MVNMRSITAASIRKRESDLLRHMLASKKRAMMSLDGPSNMAMQDMKLNNMMTPFDYKQQNVSNTPTNALTPQHRLAGEGGFCTDFSNMNNHQLRMMYQSLTNKGGSVDSGVGPILSDAMSQLNSSSAYSNNFDSNSSSHTQDYNAFMSSMNGQNGGNGLCETNNNSLGNGRMESLGNNNRMNNMANNFNGYNGGLNNNASFSEPIYGNGSTNNRGSNSYNFPQQFNNGGQGGDMSSMKGFFNKQSFAANHDTGNYSMPMKMNLNQQLFSISTSSGTTGGSDDMHGYNSYGAQF